MLARYSHRREPSHVHLRAVGMVYHTILLSQRARIHRDLVHVWLLAAADAHTAYAVLVPQLANEVCLGTGASKSLHQRTSQALQRHIV